MMDAISRLIDFLNRTNSTNLRVAVTLLVYIATTVVYLGQAIAGNQWTPSWDWLLFMGVMSGLDMLQYVGKRMTHIAEDGETISQKLKAKTIKDVRKISSTNTMIPEEDVLISTDVQEIREKQQEIG